MYIQIKPLQIIDNIPDEDELLDSSHMESLYAIRKLKVAAKYGNSIIKIALINKHNQVFIEEFDIWIGENEYVTIET